MSCIAIVPTACGIETGADEEFDWNAGKIAIVPTACGIETGEGVFARATLRRIKLQ